MNYYDMLRDTTKLTINNMWVMAELKRYRETCERERFERNYCNTPVKDDHLIDDGRKQKEQP